MNLNPENPKPSDYEAIALWGQALGSGDYYIKGAQRRAARDKAPLDAIYFDNTIGRWYYIRDLTPKHPIRIAYERLVTA